jgi:galactokinase
MNCGIMDQFASAFGKKDHAIFLDTATLQYEHVPVKLDGYKLLIANTNKKHELTTSAYNDRRRESEEALRLLQTVVDIKSLGELDEETFSNYSSVLKDDVIFRRARHAVSENQRTIKAVKALNNNDLVTFGRLMNESHISLDRDYEVTCEELNILAEAQWRSEGVLGARMTGGGFGGCTVALVRDDVLDKVTADVGARYLELSKIKPDFYIVGIGDGPCEIK